MSFKSVLFVLFLYLFSLGFAEAKPIMHIGYRIGGDGIVSSYTGDAATTTGGYTVVVGGNIGLSDAFSLDFLTGYSVDFIDTDSSKSLVQIPFDAIVKYDAYIVRFGVGMTGSIAGIGTQFEYLTSNVPLPGSYGWVALAEFKLSQSFDYFLGLKTVGIFLNSLGESQNIRETEFYFGISF